jgi:hypothetical protein
MCFQLERYAEDAYLVGLAVLLGFAMRRHRIEPKDLNEDVKLQF